MGILKEGAVRVETNFSFLGFSEETTKGVNKTTSRFVKLVRQDARKNAPQRSGALRKSIRGGVKRKSTGPIGWVRAGLPTKALERLAEKTKRGDLKRGVKYALVVEVGGRLNRGGADPHGGKHRKRRHVSLKAQPYITPALRAHEEEFVRAVEELIR